LHLSRMVDIAMTAIQDAARFLRARLEPRHAEVPAAHRPG
jgi:hypothetical protein